MVLIGLDYRSCLGLGKYIVHNQYFTGMILIAKPEEIIIKQMKVSRYAHVVDLHYL